MGRNHARRGEQSRQPGWLQEGDILKKIEGVAIDETHSYINAMFEYQSGDQVTLDVVRGNEKMQVQVTLGEAQHD